MSELGELLSAAIGDFGKVAALAKAEFTIGSVTVEIAMAPHNSPRTLPVGQMAVYAFFLKGQALKIGKVGPNSSARYTSQHYSPRSARSTLAQSILTNSQKLDVGAIDHDSVGTWIKENTDRVNLLLPVELGLPLLSLLESFLHVRMRPLFEGRAEGER